MLLIPGAWMGAWIWNDTVDRLRRRGCVAHTLTLSGLGDGERDDLASVRLADHVDDVMAAVETIGEPLVVVGHSYSGLLAGIAADRAPDRIVRTVVVAGFFPCDGRSLLDDWGSSDAERADERGEIERARMIWAPPPAEGLDADAGLDAEQAAWLGERLVPHPGHTILDPATMRRPITDQAVTVVADMGERDPRATLPDHLDASDLDHWVFRTVPCGHWPMLSCPELLDEALLEAAAGR